MKNVIITGASSGIGMALAQSLSKRGDRLVIAGRNKDRLSELSATLECEHYIHVGDVTDAADCKSMIETAVSKFGSLDILVNNAGLGFFDPLAEGSLEDWHTMVDVNVKGVLNCLHPALPHLISSAGHVINLGSVASHQVFPNSGVYCATKHALFAISESIRVELSGKVKVTTVSPGAVNTDFINKTTNEKLHAEMKDYFATAMRPENIADQIVHALNAPAGVAISEILLRPFR
jgi:NADP-dependent 3-hydroxy acid dehydrogenase YdfG